MAKYAAIFISDTHLGTRACKDQALLHFLESHECDTLYLVGDIVDLWSIRRKLYWTDTQNRVVSNILKRARHGTRVIYIPGNHDESLRQFVGETFGQNIEIHEEAIFLHPVTSDIYLIAHGDEFDFVIQKHRWLALVGSTFYDWSVVVNGAVNRVRKFLGRPYWSLSAYLKHSVKSASSYIDAFTQAATTRCVNDGYTGIICGHIHVPRISHNGPVHYINCGDWTESCSAVLLKQGGVDFELKLYPLVPTTGKKHG